MGWGREGDREGETDRQADSQAERDKETETETDRVGETHTHTNTQIESCNSVSPFSKKQSWNRGVAIHGINHLRLQHNLVYNIRGHTFFIEDGPEIENRIEDNLAIKTIPSMNLLNTDQTPAGFWIVSCWNYIRNNHAVASRRYGLWIRPEISATGTSVNTPDVHPINIPVLEISGNQAHSNGKYGLRVFDVFLPNEASVIKDLFVWRNGMVGWTATKVGKLGFDGVVSVQHGETHFEGRSTETQRWDENFIRNALFVDYIDLPLTQSYSATHDSFTSVDVLGGPMKGGLLLPWNELAGGMTISNVTFVNHFEPVLRGGAHIARGGSPSTGDGAWETRFEGINFVNTSQRALFRHPHEAFFYDLDGTLTGSGIQEDYARSGGSIIGSSLVPRSVLRPPEHCVNTDMTTKSPNGRYGDVGGMVCTGQIFRRVVFKAIKQDSLVGKSVCVRYVILLRMVVGVGVFAVSLGVFATSCLGMGGFAGWVIGFLLNAMISSCSVL